MKLRFIFALTLAAAFATACGRNDYQASFTLAFPPQPIDPQALNDTADAETFVQILNATSFWSKYVEPRLGAGMDQGKIRAGFSVAVSQVKSAAEPETWEFRVRLRTGGETAFDAFRAGFLAYLAYANPPNRPGPTMLSLQKPNPPPTTH